jgi:hypothetical protein
LLFLTETYPAASSVIWDDFSLHNIMTNLRAKFAESYPRICHPNIPTFVLPHVIDELTICAFGTALAIARLALTLVLQLVGGSTP